MEPEEQRIVDPIEEFDSSAYDPIESPSGEEVGTQTLQAVSLLPREIGTETQGIWCSNPAPDRPHQSSVKPGGGILRHGPLHLDRDDALPLPSERRIRRTDAALLDGVDGVGTMEHKRDEVLGSKLMTPGKQAPPWHKKCGEDHTTAERETIMRGRVASAETSHKKSSSSSARPKAASRSSRKLWQNGGKRTRRGQNPGYVRFLFGPGKGDAHVNIMDNPLNRKSEDFVEENPHVPSPYDPIESPSEEEVGTQTLQADSLLPREIRTETQGIWCSNPTPDRPLQSSVRRKGGGILRHGPPHLDHYDSLPLPSEEGIRHTDAALLDGVDGVGSMEHKKNEVLGSKMITPGKRPPPWHRKCGEDHTTAEHNAIMRGRAASAETSHKKSSSSSARPKAASRSSRKPWQNSGKQSRRSQNPDYVKFLSRPRKGDAYVNVMDNPLNRESEDFVEKNPHVPCRERENPFGESRQKVRCLHVKKRRNALKTL